MPVLIAILLLAALVLGTLLFFLKRFAGRRQSSFPNPFDPDPSPWPPPPEVQDRLYRSVQAYFAAQGKTVRFDDGCVYIEDPTAEFPQQLGLQNLAQVCSQSPPEEYDELVARHFGALQRGSTQVGDDPADFAEARDQLVVRLMPADLEIASHLLLRHDLPGVISVAVRDLPDVVQTVSNDAPARWKCSADEVFATALDNLIAKHPVNKETLDLGDGITIHAFLADHFFAASYALVLNRFPEYQGKEGTLVAIPHRHMLLLHPINNLTVVQAINKLGLMTVGLHRAGPGSISPKLYWYHNEEFTDLPFTLEKKAFNFHPPDQFMEVLHRLEST